MELHDALDLLQVRLREYRGDPSVFTSPAREEITRACRGVLDNLIPHGFMSSEVLCRFSDYQIYQEAAHRIEKETLPVTALTHDLDKSIRLAWKHSKKIKELVRDLAEKTGVVEDE